MPVVRCAMTQQSAPAREQEALGEQLPHQADPRRAQGTLTASSGSSFRRWDKSKLATFAHAIRSTKPAAPSKTSNVVRARRVKSSRSGAAATP